MQGGGGGGGRTRGSTRGSSSTSGMLQSWRFDDMEPGHVASADVRPPPPPFLLSLLRKPLLIEPRSKRRRTFPRSSGQKDRLNTCRQHFCLRDD
eukprot:245604-Chlamydomonas_euryale.AAC.1